ncbi:MAG: hypothetical protein M3Z87_05290 [Lactobacillus sp.]|nr:hypothetical protein [Lactobacillus sp.]
MSDFPNARNDQRECMVRWHVHYLARCVFHLLQYRDVAVTLTACGDRITQATQVLGSNPDVPIDTP